jgi:hypothetical protein
VGRRKRAQGGVLNGVCARTITAVAVAVSVTVDAGNTTHSTAVAAAAGAGAGGNGTRGLGKRWRGRLQRPGSVLDLVRVGKLVEIRGNVLCRITGGEDNVIRRLKHTRHDTAASGIGAGSPQPKRRPQPR